MGWCRLRNLTGHVLELHLGNPHTEFFTSDYGSGFSNEIEAEIDAYVKSILVGKLNPSLLDLKHLNYLDLSFNDFGGIWIPRFLGSLESLTYLNLSHAGFSGMIPHQFGNLSNLQYLDLSHNYYYNSLSIENGLFWWLSTENLFWLSSLPLLEHLDLSGVNLSKASDWLLEINTLPSLKVLKLSDCELQHFPPLSIVNFSSLVTLDLSHNRAPLIPSWVFGLSHLHFLDMHDNGIQGPIPDGLQNLFSLRHLELSWNQFNSSIPTGLYSLTHLHFLDMSGNEIQGPIPDGLQNLSSLRHLGLSWVLFNSSIPTGLYSLTHLHFLDMSYNEIQGPIPDGLQNLSSLRHLDLSVNSFNSSIPTGLYSLTHLQYLSLQYNNLQGMISGAIVNLTSIERLDLSYNYKLEGRIPRSFGRLCKLRTISLNYVKLSQSISEILDIFSGCLSDKLELLDLSSTQIFGYLTNQFGQFKNLHTFGLGNNSILGPIPSFLGELCSLEYLDVSFNKLNGTLSKIHFRNLTKLTFLNISHNQIHGEIPSLPKGIRFGILDLSSNNLSGPLPLIYPIYVFDLSNNKFQGSISHFVCHRMHESKETKFLKLRSNFLSEELPDCWKIWPFLKILDLGNNKFTGNLPISMGTLSELRSLRLRKNNLSGTIPASLGNCTELETLDVGENELVGTIPIWIGERLSSMLILNLRSNKFHGFLPRELCNLASLQILDVAHNNLSGSIPRCISNISAMVTMDSSNGQNSVKYQTNSSFGSAIEGASLVIKGQMAEYNTILNLVRSIDLSINKFSGEIPIEVTSLVALQSLNLSYNSFTGKIPANVGAMKSLESVDFSWNQLSGEIPQSISSLNFLSYLNLSNNNLIGKIPMSTQLQGFDPSCFMGNELCGSPLPKNCTSPTPGRNENDRGKYDGEHEVNWFYVSVALGFIVGFWSLIGPLIVNRRWRYMYCRFLERLGDITSSIVRKCF